MFMDRITFLEERGWSKYLLFARLEWIQQHQAAAEDLRGREELGTFEDLTIESRLSYPIIDRASLHRLMKESLIGFYTLYESLPLLSSRMTVTLK